LHEKIYLHQKIRSAEIQARSILASISTAFQEYRRVHMWLYLRESLVDQPSAQIYQTSPLFRQNGEVESWDPIVNRDLPVRAFAYGWQNSISEPLSPDHYSTTARRSVEQLISLTRATPEVFEAEIHKHLSEIATKLKYGARIYTPSFRLFVDPPRVSTIQQGVDTIHFKYPPRLSPHWTMPIDQIEKYYYRNRALGYVFAAGTNVACVLLASELAAYGLTGTVCVQEGLVGHRTNSEAEALRIKLDGIGFYRDAPSLRPVPQYLASVEAQDIIREVAGRLASYEPKSLCRVSPASVTTFLAQFELPLQKTALLWLKHVEFVRPEVGIKEEINQIVRGKLTLYRTIGISPIGAINDSAAHLGYKLRDPLEDPLRQMVSAQVLPLTEALACRSDAYILYDDNANTGHQTLNIFAGWLGKTLPEDLNLNEEHVQPLSIDLQMEITSKPLFLVFNVATENATANLKRLLVTHLGLNGELVTCVAHRELRDRDKIFSGQAFQEENKFHLRDFLIDVATSIFFSEGRSNDAARKRALGDNEAEAMIVFPYNCPTMTIPALWLRGPYRGTEWMPLVERNRRRHPTKGGLVGEDA
jgi:hypothetical protein